MESETGRTVRPCVRIPSKGQAPACVSSLEPALGRESENVLPQPRGCRAVRHGSKS
jgi:hypothetical protein